MTRTLAALVMLLGYQGLAQTVTSLTLSPATIAGGSGAASTATVTLSAAAPAGGTLVTLSSSNTALAASRPSVTVAAGATSASFTLATNALYRRYSGLSFTANISASANGSTASALLTVTAQPLPPDINGDTMQREGFMCGGTFPARQGEHGILYQCFVAQNGATVGTCRFQQECQLGCQTVPPNGFQYNDVCATAGPNPVTVNPGYIISGDRPGGALVLGAPAGTGYSGSANTNSVILPIGAQPIPTGATSLPFQVTTSYQPTTQFAAVVGDIYDGQNHRLGLTWLTMVPPDPPPAQPIPTVASINPGGPNPVTGGQGTFAFVQASGVSPNGTTYTLASSNPAVASAPASITVPAGSTWAQMNITTQPVAATTNVTLSASDGRYTVTLPLTVQASTCTPTSCAAQGANCGTISDGCGGTLTCGSCTSPQTCGGSGVPNVCGAAVLSSITLAPSSVSGGSSSAGSVTLTSAAPANGAAVTLSSNNAAASVPLSITVPAGSTSASFTATTSPVTTNQTATISASYGGVSKGTLLSIFAPTTSPADTVAVTLAEYKVADSILSVQATSTSATATLQVFVSSTGALIGTLTNAGGGKYQGQFSWAVNPQNITVKSSLGGVATSAVAAK